MKQIHAVLVVLVGLASFTGPAVAGQTWVDGYIRSDGTYVAGHWRSTPDQYKHNNLGSPNSSDTRGNFTNLYGRDQDGDGLSNQFDYDDDNDGIWDDWE